MSLLDQLKKNSTIKESQILSKSIYFTEKEFVTTDIPAINIALSGKLDGGFASGLTMWAGPSKHFKTLFTLIMIKAYLDRYKDAICLFYDSEFGTPQSYFSSVGIDMSRILHSPITNVEELKHDIMAQLKEIKRDDKIIIAVDSIGNLASLKEVTDAEEGKTVGDMTRAKQIKSIFRMVTPHLSMKNIPMVVVNHIYMTQEMYSKAVVSGGTGIYLSSDNIFIIGRQQEKEGTEIIGYNFVINIEKSRHSREKSKIPVTVLHEGGLDKWSSLFEMAIDSGHLLKDGISYRAVDKTTGEIAEVKWKRVNIPSSYFEGLIKDETFKEYVSGKYSVTTGNILGDDAIDTELALIEEEDETI